MKRDALNHPKTLDFASRLGIPRSHAIGLLQLLFDFTATFAAQGDIGKHRNGAISRGCDWAGDPDEFINALIESGWIDKDPVYRLVIHDWSEHCEQWVKLKLKKLNLPFAADKKQAERTAAASAVCTAGHAAENTVEASASRDLAKPSLAKPSLAKPSESQAVPSATSLALSMLEDQSFASQWKRWIRHRIEKHKPLGAVEEESQLYDLLRFGVDEATAIVAFSINRGAVNLITNGDHKGKPPPSASSGSVGRKQVDLEEFVIK